MTRPKKFDERQLMKKSIEVMKESVHEKRDDGKVCPSVGALLVKPDGTEIAACRGELRLGDHAEYTLIERKLNGENCEGAILFTTLEPCTTRSRNGQYLPKLMQQIFEDEGKDLDKIEQFIKDIRRHKMGCAQRIVDARISEVWIGIEDPNVDIDGGGIKLLEENNIPVHLYDKDLQNEIRKFNKKYLEHSESTRQKSVFVEGLSPDLLSFNNPLDGFSFDDLSKGALEFLARETKQENILSKGFHDFLLQEGVLIKVGDNEVVTKVGYLLFGKDPRSIFPQAGLSLTVTSKNEPEEIEDFIYPLVLIPVKLEEFLERRFPKFLDRNSMVHLSVSAIPLKLIRESVVNALIHRDYSVQGANCHLVISEDRIEVKSPGMPISQISLEQLNAFTAPMINRNPQIAYLFSLCHLAEQRGFGMRSFKEAEKKYSIPKPFYDFDDPYLVLTIYRNQSALLDNVPKNALDKYTEKDLKELQVLFSKGEFKREEYQEALNLTDRTAQRHIYDLITSGSIIQIGAGRSAKYKVVKK